jgi:hypothetical protein
MLESVFKARTLKEIESMFPDCIIFANDANRIQGIADTLVLHGPKWVALEFKRARRASRRPNQEYYVDLLDKMSFARFISPENKEVVLDEIQKVFRS